MTRTTPIFSMTPDYTPIVRMMAMQTRFAIETSQGMMKLAMLPWTGLPRGLASICTPLGSVTVAATLAEAKPARPVVVKSAPAARTPAPEVIEAKAVEVTEAPVAQAETPVAKAVTPAAKAVTPAAKAVTAPVAPLVEKATAAPAPKAEKMAAAPAPKADSAPAPKVEAAPAAKAEAAPAPKVEKAAEPAPAVTADPAPATDAPAAMVKPKAIAAPAKPDDLTVLDGVGPKLAEALNAEGIYTYAQIAAWTAENVAWADENLPGVPGRASRNGWVAQAAGLAK